jgi:hypothetical protein
VIAALASWFTALAPEKQASVFGMVLGVLSAIAVAVIVMEIRTGIRRPAVRKPRRWTLE